MEKLKNLLEISPFFSDEYKEYILSQCEKNPQLIEKFIKIFEDSNEKWQTGWQEYVENNKKITSGFVKTIESLEFENKAQFLQKMKQDIKNQEIKEKNNADDILSNI